MDRRARSSPRPGSPCTTTCSRRAAGAGSSAEWRRSRTRTALSPDRIAWADASDLALAQLPEDLSRVDGTRLPDRPGVHRGEHREGQRGEDRAAAVLEQPVAFEELHALGLPPPKMGEVTGPVPLRLAE